MHIVDASTDCAANATSRPTASLSRALRKGLDALSEASSISRQLNAAGDIHDPLMAVDLIEHLNLASRQVDSVLTELVELEREILALAIAQGIDIS